MKRFYSLFLAILLLIFPSCGEKKVERTFLSMDTAVSLSLYGEHAREGTLMAEAFLNLLEEKLDAEGPVLAALTQTGCSSDPLLYDLLEKTLDCSRKTKGALDVTLYPVIKAWGFIDRHYRVPTDRELAALAPLVDMETLTLQGDKIYIKPGQSLTLGAVAKGYAGSALAQRLKDMGCTRGVLSLGGNVVLLGDKFGKGWEVGIRDPVGGNALILSLKDCSVITSGGYERFFEQDGLCYHHIIDPQTLCPAETDLLSVTVISRDGLMADALSTALFVMGREKAIDYFITYGDKDGFDLVLLSRDNRAYITPRLSDCYKLPEGKSREVTVINP